ncbi:ataxin-7-like protein 3 isoform 1 [Danio rerio]|nr:ataxin-7-like protein 3 isoform 1 [Danio rerio]CAD43430.2 novel protein [Danio rerio]|eukprot:NP_001005396.1 ataxin-7-like protein 3 isoform 1 [Danio rerio]
MKMEDMSLSGLDNTKLEALAHDVYSDLVEDACLGLCFEVHRAVKQGYFFLDETDQESMKDFEIVDQPGVDIFGQVYNQWKNKECVCPNCSRSIAASRFAPHLEKCLGMGRNSSRIANRRIASSNNTSKSESDQEDNDDINDNDWSYGSEKKAKKRKSEKNPNSPRRSKSLKHKNGELSGSVNPDMYKYNYSSGISYETLGPEELRMRSCVRAYKENVHSVSRSSLSLVQCVMPRCVLAGPSGVPSTRTNRGGQSESSSLGRPRQHYQTLTPCWKTRPMNPLMASSSCPVSIGTLPLTSPHQTRHLQKPDALGLSSRKKRPKLAVPPAPSIYDDLN